MDYDLEIILINKLINYSVFNLTLFPCVMAVKLECIESYLPTVASDNFISIENENTGFIFIFVTQLMITSTFPLFSYFV